MLNNKIEEYFDELLILGGGGHGKVVAETAIASKIFKKIYFLDDNFNKKEGRIIREKSNILGPIKNISDQYFKNKFRHAFVAIGDSNLRLSLIKKLKDNNYIVPSLIHPSALVSPSAKIGAGSILLPNSVVCAETHIGEGVILNTSCSVDHQCNIKNGAHICPGVNIAGEVIIGKKSWIGIGASIKQCIKIGENVTVGAGAAVVNDLPDSVVAVGVPAKISKFNLR